MVHADSDLAQQEGCIYIYIHTDVHTHNLLSPGQALPLALETYRQRLLQVPASSFPADFPSTKHTC